jgi:predicted LPLAT superfamily acyltransferase
MKTLALRILVKNGVNEADQVHMPFFRSSSSLFVKGYLDRGHYNFFGLEKRHYYSHILKFATTILDSSQLCHGIRMKTTRVQLQV